MKLLIVEDDEVNRFLMEFYFKGKKHMVFTAKNGKEGLQIFNDVPDLDLILTDIMMPLMNGIELLQEVRKSKINSNIPVIAITAGLFTTSSPGCQGFTSIHYKPLKLANLIKITEELLEGANEQKKEDTSSF